MIQVHIRDNLRRKVHGCPILNTFLITCLLPGVPTLAAVLKWKHQEYKVCFTRKWPVGCGREGSSEMSVVALLMPSLEHAIDSQTTCSPPHYRPLIQLSWSAIVPREGETSSAQGHLGIPSWTRSGFIVISNRYYCPGKNSRAICRRTAG